MEETRYNYSVNPRKRIKTDSPVLKNIRTPKTLMLTKKEVVDAIKSSSIVYRRFDGLTRVKVNLMNLERLHQEKYDPTIEQSIVPLTFDEEKVGEPIEEKMEEITLEPVRYDVTAPVEVTLVSDPKPLVLEEQEDTEIENQTIEEAVEATAEVISDPIVEEQPIDIGETVEESIPDVIEPTVEVEEVKEDTQNNNKKYNNNKRHH